MKTFHYKVCDCYDKRIWKLLLLPRILARIEDSEVLARAADEKLVILTFDRDYIEILYGLFVAEVVE
jgi:predicted nuclease of predicted toxin-antitoxin system